MLQIDILHCIKSQKGMSWNTPFFCNLDNEHLSMIHMCIKIRDNFLHWTQPTMPNGHRTLCHHIVRFHDNDRLLHHKSWIKDKIKHMESNCLKIGEDFVRLPWNIMGKQKWKQKVFLVLHATKTNHMICA